MKAIRSAQSASPTPPPAAAEPLRWEWLARVWERMVAAFPGRWVLSMGASPHPIITGPDGRETVDTSRLTMGGQTWAAGLAGMSAEQLGAGLQACMTRWSEPRLPTLGEFRALCFGIPRMSEVREDIARTGQRRAPFTVVVLRHLDWYAYRHADVRDADNMLREAYARARDSVMRGEPLPELPPELPSCENPQETKPARDPQVAKNALAEIAAMLGTDKTRANDAA